MYLPDLLQILSAACLVLAVALLWFAYHSRWLQRTTAVLALLCGAGGSGLMLLSYAGGKPVVLDRAGAGSLERRPLRDRGTFDYSDRGGRSEGSGGQGNAGAGGSSAGGSGSGGFIQSALAQLLPSSAIRRAPFQPGSVVRDCPECPEMVVIQPGYFRMGAALDDGDARPQERPIRVVRHEKRFMIGRYEVTVAEYATFARDMGLGLPRCGNVQLEGRDPAEPVRCVSWRDAQAYAAWLAHRTGLKFRLPTESEWEYAARGGRSERYQSGATLADDAGNVGKGGQPVRVGSFAPNGFGLYDMHGNVAELVTDCWRGSPAVLPGDGGQARFQGTCTTRSLRDASADEAATMARVSARRPIATDARWPGTGFRLARSLD